MESTSPKYRIVFDGHVLPGENTDQVKQRLATLFKVDTSVIDNIFRQCPYTLQRNRDKETALKYKHAVEQTGALCRLEMEPPPIPQQPPQPPQPPRPPRPPLAPTSPPAAASPAFRTSPPPIPPVPIPPIPSRKEQPGGTLYSEPAPPHPPTNGAVRGPVSSPKRMETIGRSEAIPHLKKIDRDTWKTLGGGLGITILVLIVPFLSFIFHYIVTLVHELGHAIFGWLYGYPSVPAFDFMYGGGITSHQDRKTYIIVVVYLILAALFYLCRRIPFMLVGLGIFTLLYSLTAFTIAHQLIILFMGHGTELIFGAIFLYRGLSGSSIIVPAERPLYAFLGFFVIFVDLRFAYRLMTSEVYRAEYGAAKGGGHWMDFSRIANEILGVELHTVASFFLLLCLLTPIIVYLVYRYKEYIGKFSRDYLGISSD